MRYFYLFYGLLAYAAFHASFLYLIGFTSDVFVPTSVARGGPESPMLEAVLTNIGLILVFGIQHGIMARAWFKRRWTRIIPAPIERSTFVIVTGLVLALMYWQWRPLPEVVWQIDGPWATVMWTVSALGWLTVVLSSFQIDHFELFGVKQTLAAFRGQEPRSPAFKARGLYSLVRHPLMLGFLTAFWTIPTMTYGGLVFGLTFTTFTLVALQIEERSLVAAHGSDYTDYRDRVPMLLPLPRFTRTR